MSMKNFDLLKNLGIKLSYVAQRMGMTENLLRYHLSRELRHQETQKAFFKTLKALSREIGKEVEKLEKTVE